MSDDPVERKPLRVSNQAYLAFKDMFIGWVDDNIQDLEFGNAGDVRELSRLCAKWCGDYLVVSDGKE